METCMLQRQGTKQAAGRRHNSSSSSSGSAPHLISPSTSGVNPSLFVSKNSMAVSAVGVACKGRAETGFAHVSAMHDT